MQKALGFTLCKTQCLNGLSVRTQNQFSVTGCIDTNDLLLRFLRNTTMPSMRANNVWSLPRPTFSPGL